MTTRSEDEEDYFSDPVKLVHTAEDKTFITDERFIDAEIIDLGDILSPEEDAEYESPQMTQAPVPTQLKTPDSCRNRFLNPSVTLVDCCKRLSKNKRLTPHTDNKALERAMKTKHKEHKSEDFKTDSDIEIINQIDSNKSKTYKNNLTHLTHQIEIKKAIDQRNIVQVVDIKKNTGLVGLKIKPSNIDLKKSFGKSSKENTKNEQKTNTTHTLEKVRKNSRNIHKVKTKTNLKKKDEKATFKSNPKEYTDEWIKKNKDLVFIKHPKKELPENLDKFDKEKKTDRNVSKSPTWKTTLSPSKACRDYEKSLAKNVSDNDTKTKLTLKKVMSVWTIPSKDKEHNQINFKQKSMLEKYTNSKGNGDNKAMTHKNTKEIDQNDNEQSIVIKFTAGQSNPETNNVVEQRSFPTLNKFTKNVLKKALEAGKIPPKTNPVKTNQEEKHIRSNMNLHMKENNMSPNREAAQTCKDLQPANIKKSDTAFKDNDGRKNMKTDPVPKLFHSPKQNTNLKLESSLRGNQNLTANNWKTQPVNYTPFPLAQTIEMNAKEASVVKLPFPFPSVSCNTSTIAPQTNVQLQQNVPNINNTKETFSNAFQSTNQHFPIATLVTDRNNIENPRHDIVLQYNKPPPQIQKQPVQNEKVDMTKPPPHLNGHILQKVPYMHQTFPDAKMMKKTPTAPHNMNLYRPPPPNAYTSAPYQSFYPMMMPSVPDSSRMYTVNHQNYGCRVGPYMLPYGTEIFLHPPPQPPPPPPPLPPPPPFLPIASQQQLQQKFSNTGQLSTQDSIIGRNDDGVIKKINITALPSNKQDVSNTEVDSKEEIVKVFSEDDIQQNVKEAVAITPTVMKSEIPTKLDSVRQPGNITVFTHSPKNNLKRPLTSQFPIRDEKKKNKPCPLSKKVKVSDSRTLPKKGQINREPAKKGYSPPILPIPTFENILSQTRAYDMGYISDTIVEKAANKNNMTFPPRHDHHTEVRKITLDEYKKKNSIPSDKTKENKYRRLDKLVKNLCQK